ncbi:T9SS type B sorting domain-containing protein [Dokdonia sp. Hel_I_53]|uniref:T9SS type B sorting domain-containing protein n=1 Tax=Dokdonia sp. Hel_I_53 TaxID=1566287 RepID=UPI0021BD4450|nr:T9SS type B sorting domain-containing protein [Dokdonia sp. Hel_I_53]
MTVDSQIYSPQQLVEDILINSNCISNIQVTNVLGGNFGGGDQSYGYFNSNGSSFPLQEGIVLSTGRLQNVQGPNTTLSDDDAQNWAGDTDLENVLNETNTTNATLLEFNFQSTASEVRFRYLFASEEYQEGNPNTCQFSDLFGFLIREEGTQQFQNIALVPDTNTPVKVTTVHPEIPNGCAAINEFYFDTFNDNSAPINFNGQTKVLEAKAFIRPNITYQVKLVIADEQNYRFDSAVFLEAGSFQLGVDLGEDRTINGGNAVCESNFTTLSVDEPDAVNYQWFRDGVLLLETSNELIASQDGFYEVIIDLQNNCQAFGEITIEFAENPEVFNSNLDQCDENGDGIAVYNLFDSFESLTGNLGGVRIQGFYYSLIDAQDRINSINNPDRYTNTIPNELIYAVIESQSGCSSIGELTLTTSNLTLNLLDQIVCDDDISDGIAIIDLNYVTSQFQDQLPSGTTVAYYLTVQDAYLEENRLGVNYTTSNQNLQLFVRVNDGGQCISISEVSILVESPPQLEIDEQIFYCLNTYPETISISSGVADDTSLYQYEWSYNGVNIDENTSEIQVNETGVYMASVTNQNNCTSSRIITLVPSDVAIINDVDINSFSDNSTVTINVTGDGLYEYSIGNSTGPYQEENTFENVSPGFYEVFVRDKNGCGVSSKIISVLGFPKFFTPNGDGTNDTWMIQGASDQINTTVRFIIFDRYGKVLYQSRSMGQGWNGIFNGKLLPRNDYWYFVQFEDGSIHKGNFSLVR